MPFGIVKSWNSKKGWGFIRAASPNPTPETPTAEYFVHWSDVEVVDKNGRRNLDAGRHVEFTPVLSSEKQLKARKVRYPEDVVLTITDQPTVKAVRS
jgi:cold shock CspA family protein